jgi:hypothetical protein
VKFISYRKSVKSHSQMKDLNKTRKQNMVSMIHYFIMTCCGWLLVALATAAWLHVYSLFRLLLQVSNNNVRITRELAIVIYIVTNKHNN